MLWGAAAPGLEAWSPSLSILELSDVQGPREVFAPTPSGWGGLPLPPAKCPKPGLGCLSATGYGSSPGTFHSWPRFIPGCLKRSSPNRRSGKTDRREGGQDSCPEPHFLAGRETWPPLAPLPPLPDSCQSRDWGKRGGVFGGPALLPRSGHNECQLLDL